VVAAVVEDDDKDEVEDKLDNEDEVKKQGSMELLRPVVIQGTSMSSSSTEER
jgi:hypothetical protein